MFHNCRRANGGVPGGVSPNGSIQNDSGLPQAPSFRAITRKPSSLISCSHSGPEGGSRRGGKGRTVPIL